MEQEGISTQELTSQAQQLAEQAKTPLYFALEGKLLGVIAVADKVKQTSASTIARLRAMGVKSVMLTGDQATTANVIGKELGVDQVISDVLPSQKESYIRQFQDAGEKRCHGRRWHQRCSSTRASKRGNCNWCRYRCCY